MIDLMKEVFLTTATHLVVLIVPITAIAIGFRLFFAGLYGGKRD